MNTLAKISLLNSNDWDLTHVPSIMDLSLVLEGILARFDEIVVRRRQATGRELVTVTGLDAADGLFRTMIPSIRGHKIEFERRRTEIMRKANEMSLDTQPFSRGGGAAGDRFPPQMQTLQNSVMQNVYPTDPHAFHFNEAEMPPLNFSKLDDAFWSEFMGDYGVS